MPKLLLSRKHCETAAREKSWSEHRCKIDGPFHARRDKITCSAREKKNEKKESLLDRSEASAFTGLYLQEMERKQRERKMKRRARREEKKSPRDLGRKVRKFHEMRLAHLR